MILEDAIDRLPRLRNVIASDYGATILRRIERAFPDLAPARHAEIRRAYFRHRLANGLAYRLTLRFPAFAAMVARCIPVRGREHLDRANSGSEPVVIASAHFGPVYFHLLIIARLLSGRRLYVIYASSGPDAARNAAFLRSRGLIPVPNDASGLRALIGALDSAGRIAILIAFDLQNNSRRRLPFLGTALPVSGGLGFLADIGGGPIIPWFWQCRNWKPSVWVGEACYADDRLGPAQRRGAIVETFHRLLEARVAQHPEQWKLAYLGDPVAAPVSAATPAG